MPSSNKKVRRKMKMSKKALDSFKSTDQCHFLWDNSTENFVDNLEKHKFFCHTNMNGTKLFYKKYKNTYRFIGYSNKIRYCLGRLNDYSMTPISEGDLCKNNDPTFKKYKIISSYLSLLSKKKTVKSFFKELFELIFIHSESRLSYEELLSNILSGGYCVISNDKGYIFNRLVTMFKSSKKLKRGLHYGKGGCDGFSSHFSDGDQYRLGSGALFNISDEINTDFDMVIGRRPILDNWQYDSGKQMSYFIDNEGDTWFQFEAHRNESALEKIKHGISAIDYGVGMLASCIIPSMKLKNIGPYGRSVYTEFNPLVLNFCGMSSNKLKMCSIKS